MEKRNLLLAFRSERERAALAEAFSGLEGITLLPPTATPTRCCACSNRGAWTSWCWR